MKFDQIMEKVEIINEPQLIHESLIYHINDEEEIKYVNRHKHWRRNGERHRADGPAIEYSNGSKFWYLNGKLHRTDGPAVEYVSGSKSWFLNDQKYSEEKYNEEVKK